MKFIKYLGTYINLDQVVRIKVELNMTSLDITKRSPQREATITAYFANQSSCNLGYYKTFDEAEKALDKLFSEDIDISINKSLNDNL